MEDFWKKDGRLGRQGRNLFPQTNKEAYTENTTKHENDQKTEEQTTHTWGRREDHTEKSRMTEL